MRKVLIWLLGLVAAGMAAIVAWLAVAPPDLLRVGDGYAAKIVCSNVFIAGRDADAVLAQDVQAPGHPLLRFVRISVDDVRKDGYCPDVRFRSTRPCRLPRGPWLHDTQR